jgi:hypothetical protein
MTQTLVTLSFVAGAIPAVALFILYGLRVRWEETATGRWVFTLVAITAVSYGTSTVVVLFPHWFHDAPGAWWRITIRFIIAVALWGLLAIFVRAQRSGYPNRQKDTENEKRS